MVSAGQSGSLLLALAACQPAPDRPGPTTPPVGHYEGSIAAAGQPATRAALDIRHPGPGRYEAEFTVPSAATLSFVADTVAFGAGRLRLVRPARPAETLTLVLDGDFWRGTLALDSLRAKTLLLRRGEPTPSAYRVAAVPLAAGPAWLFAPSDAGTRGPALALLPDPATAPAAALWADALARQGVIVLVLPADSSTGQAEGPRLAAALRRLRGTAGADTANVGAWAAGARAAAVAQALAAAGGPRAAFLITQNMELDPAAKAAFRDLRRRNVPLLGLYGGAATREAAALRNVLGGRRGALVRVYRAAGPDLLVPGALGPGFGPGLPGQVAEWVRVR